MRLTRLFRNKDNRLKQAFRAVKADMDFMDENHKSLKDSTNEWIIFLDQENRDLKMMVMELEKRLESLQDNLEEKEISVLRTV